MDTTQLFNLSAVVQALAASTGTLDVTYVRKMKVEVFFFFLMVVVVSNVSHGVTRVMA